MGSRPVLVWSLAVLVLVVAIALVWQALGGQIELSELLHFITGPGYLLGFPLLYIEESGVPLPLPGDVFLMYAGKQLPHDPTAWAAAWLAFVVCVTLGASNLYWLARRFGRGLAMGRAGALLHLTPARLEWAESWFDRWGMIAVIFGRHLPGGRIPITVAAGVLGMRYPMFALGVMVSAMVWAAFWLAVGIIFGSQLERILKLHQQFTIVAGALIAAGIVLYVGSRVVAWRRAGKRE